MGNSKSTKFGPQLPTVYFDEKLILLLSLSWQLKTKVLKYEVELQFLFARASRGT
jgi:hypothetical protein